MNQSALSHWTLLVAANQRIGKRQRISGWPEHKTDMDRVTDPIDDLPPEIPPATQIKHFADSPTREHIIPTLAHRRCHTSTRRSPARSMAVPMLGPPSLAAQRVVGYGLTDGV